MSMQLEVWAELDIDRAERIRRGREALLAFRAEAAARERAMEEREQAFLAEKIDTTQFSPRFQHIIAEYERKQEAFRREHETALEYLRRKFPDMPEWARLNYMFLCAIGGIPLREAVESPGEP